MYNTFKFGIFLASIRCKIEGKLGISVKLGIVLLTKNVTLPFSSCQKELVRVLGALTNYSSMCWIWGRKECVRVCVCECVCLEMTKQPQHCKVRLVYALLLSEMTSRCATNKSTPTTKPSLVLTGRGSAGKRK